MSRFRDVTKGPGDLPGDSTNPNSPDFDPSADEARDEDVDALLADPKWREAHADAADDDELQCNAVRRMQWAKDRRAIALARCKGGAA
jgi:hypothetical protein